MDPFPGKTHFQNKETSLGLLVQATRVDPQACYITCLEISPNRPEPTNSKMKNSHENLAKRWKFMHYLIPRKETRPENLTVNGNPSKTLGKATFPATWKARARKRRAGHPRGAPRNHNVISRKSLENERFPMSQQMAYGALR